MAGLVAARALAEFFETVTVVERDALSDAADHRRGVPQGRQAHGLLLRGAQALDELSRGSSTNSSEQAHPRLIIGIYRSSTSTWAATWPCNPVRPKG
jgi:2-polyprenyl-6-methoxyphenol hydroxylase-like FAD-dependent oxidoreductase